MSSFPNLNLSPDTLKKLQQAVIPELSTNPADVPMFQAWPSTGPQNVLGMKMPGNIDLTKRPLVHHPDGSVSTLYSGSFSTPDGEVLVPLVSPDGKMMTMQQAKELYNKTGQHLGIFKTPDQATWYSEFLHSKQGGFQTWKNGGMYKAPVETWDNWKDTQ